MEPNIVDLDEYRQKRIEEGTWPLTKEQLEQYWRQKVEERKIPEKPKKTKGSVEEDVALLERMIAEQARKQEVRQSWEHPPYDAH